MKKSNNIINRINIRNGMIECHNQSIAKLIEYNKTDILLLRELEQTGDIE